MQCDDGGVDGGMEGVLLHDPISEVSGTLCCTSVGTDHAADLWQH